MASRPPHCNLVPGLDDFRPLGSGAVMGVRLGLGPELQDIYAPRPVIGPAAAGICAQQRIGVIADRCAEVGPVGRQGDLDVIVDRGDGRHVTRLEVDRDDVGDVVANLADPRQTLDFDHAARLHQLRKYDVAKYVRVRCHRARGRHQGSGTGIPRGLSTGLSTNWGQLTQV